MQQAIQSRFAGMRLRPDCAEALLHMPCERAHELFLVAVMVRHEPAAVTRHGSHLGQRHSGHALPGDQLHTAIEQLALGILASLGLAAAFAGFGRGARGRG